MFCAAVTDAGHEVHLGLEAHAGHAERLLDAVLVVDRVLLREHVEDLAVLRDVDRLGLLEHRGDVGLFDFLVLDRPHALRVERLDVRARDAGVDRRDLARRPCARPLRQRAGSTAPSASMLTTTPFFRPVDGWVPTPMMSTPSSVTSPTMQAILVVPMSSPTTSSSRLAMILANPSIHCAPVAEPTRVLRSRDPVARGCRRRSAAPIRSIRRARPAPRHSGRGALRANRR